MTENINYKGYWKLPSSEKFQVPGELTFDINSQAKLSLLGIFAQNEGEDDVSYPIIHGFSTNGKKITLLNCRGFKYKPIPGIATISFNVEYILVGDYFKSEDEIKLDAMSVHFLYLDQWVDRHGIDIKELSDKPYSVEMKFTHPEAIPLYSDEKKDISIWFSAVSPLAGSILDNTIQQKIYIDYQYKEKASLSEALQDINRFRNFLSFGLSMVIIPTEVILYPKKEGATEHTLIYKEEYYPNLSKLKDHIFDYTTLFSFHHIETKVKEILSNWFIKYQTLQPVFDRYFDCIYNPKMYQVNHFLNLISAIETYHRRTFARTYFPQNDFDELKKILFEALPKNKQNKDWFEMRFSYANEISLRTRLKEICTDFNDILLLIEPNIKAFVSKVVDTRNYYVHYDIRLKDHAIGDNEMYLYNSTMVIILQLVLLKELGFTFEEMENAVKRSLPNWDRFHS